MPPDFTALLSDRRIIRVSGEDAQSFLQNVITNDMARLEGGKIIYACLLTPQGQFLHDFFILKDGDSFLLDAEAARADDLLRRFNIFRLRSKVVFGEADGLKVYATATQGYADPRRGGLGCRLYTKNELPAEPAARYYDYCIENGIPSGSLTVRPERDTMADVNLDLLNAVAWDKGCFIGQEVAARMHHRGLSKRRLFVVKGSGLVPGPLKQNNSDAGEIRQVNSRRDTGLAVVKLAAASQKSAALAMEQGAPVTLADSPV